MVIERLAKGGARVAGTGAGSFLGGLFSNPAVIILGALGIGLFVFKDKISGFFEGLKFPEIKLPDINIDFPDLPPPPDLSGFDLCSLFGIGCDAEAEEEVETSPEILEADCQCGTDIVQDATGTVTVTCKVCQDVGMDPALLEEPGDAELFAMDFPEPIDEIPIPPPPEPIVEPPPPIIVDPELDIPPDVEFVGGGPSFIGGSIGQTPVTTLFQVLALFSGFSASQAANFLFQFSGISPSEALDLPQFKQFQ